MTLGTTGALIKSGCLTCVIHEMFGLFSAAGIETTAEAAGIVQILLKMLLLLMLANIVMLQ
jgi:hypothetical protein